MTRVKDGGESEDAFATYFEGVLNTPYLRRGDGTQGPEKRWRWMHPRPALDTRRRVAGKAQWRTALQGNPGWPDYAITDGTRFMVVELKSEDGTLSPDQRAWLAMLQQAGVETHVFRPSDRAEIEALLL